MAARTAPLKTVALQTLARFSHVEANFAAANQPKLLWELAGDHNESVADPPRLTEGFEKFLCLIEAQPAKPAAQR